MSLGSDSLRFIYIRVPRTGSASFLRELDAPDLEQRGRQHEPAIVARELWGAKWDEYRTFGFIRNPWEWLVSVYNAGLSVSAGPPEIWPGGPVEPGDAPGTHQGQRMNMAFPDWVRARKTTPMDWLRDATGIIVDEIMRTEDMASPLRIGAVSHAHYREWYSEDLAGYVEQKCAAEIEAGGYAF